MNIIGTLLIIFCGVILNAKTVLIVSILPQQTFLKKIAKDKIDITVMIKPGISPHSYEPKPSQMIAISKATVYLSIGVEIEDIWLKRLKSQNKKLEFIDISKDVSKIGILEHIIL